MKLRMKRAWCWLTTRHRKRCVETYDPPRQVETSDGCWLLDSFWRCRCGKLRHGEGTALPF